MNEIFFHFYGHTDKFEMSDTFHHLVLLDSDIKQVGERQSSAIHCTD